jgi:hypothetical protein
MRATGQLHNGTGFQKDERVAPARGWHPFLSEYHEAFARKQGRQRAEKERRKISAKWKGAAAEKPCTVSETCCMPRNSAMLDLVCKVRANMRTMTNVKSARQ